MPSHDPHYAASITGPFRGNEAISERLLTKKQLRSPLFTQLFHNVYLPSAIPISHELRCRGAACIAPPSATITGVSAAAVYGFDFAGVHDPVELIVDEEAKFTAKRGMHIRRCTLGPAEGTPWYGVQLATPWRTTVDILCNTKLRRSLPQVVSILDALLRARFVDPAQLRRLLRRRSDRGIQRARTALDHADPRAESLPESELRVWLALGGLRPEPQVEVFDNDGAFLGRLDLGFREARLAVEYDGAWHNDPDQRHHDQRRRDRLRAHGWEFVIVTKDWFRSDPRDVVETIRRALCRRSALPGGSNQGTLPT